MLKTHLVQRQVQGPQANEHNSILESIHQHGTQAQQRPQETQQLHGRVRIQAETRAQPQQGGRGEQLFPEWFTAVSQLPASRQQSVITIET